MLIFAIISRPRMKQIKLRSIDSPTVQQAAIEGVAQPLPDCKQGP